MALAAALLIGAFPISASAEPAPSDVGVHRGVMNFYKSQQGCEKGSYDQNSAANTNGGGLGLFADGTQHYHMKMGAAPDGVYSVRSAPAVGQLELCGDLEPALTGVTVPHLNGTTVEWRPGIGANCIASKGAHGVGMIDFPGSLATLWLDNVGWKATAGNYFPITGEVSIDEAGGSTKNGVAGAMLFAPTYLTDGFPLCGGASAWNQIVGAYAIAGPYVSSELPLATCKESGNSACLYGDKQTAPGDG